jgi:pullulanase
MKILTLSIAALFLAMNFNFNIPWLRKIFLHEDYPVYEGKDLGLTYSPQKSVFKIWSPKASQAKFTLYDKGAGGSPVLTQKLKKDKKGIWCASLKGDWEGKFYTFSVMIDGNWLPETPDPYAVAVGVNGSRAMVVDLAKTNPPGWEQDKRPPLKSFADIILYELHFRDLSMHPASGIRNKGKFLGLTESGTKTPGGESTGLDHLKDLGVTHIHLLPSYDFSSIDETMLNASKFNWGYDPQNYNTPEGSYATDPCDGRVRIREFKNVVKTLHDNGLRVIMDVVYNHTGKTEGSVFNNLVPGYYYRQNADGSWSNASACGNETASEKPMMRKYMLESMLHWVKEYHVDGFRVDLMGIHDIETMNLIARELRKIDPSIFIYGEGWTAGGSPLPDEKRALKSNTYQLDGIAAFSDDFRDGVKGHVFKPLAKGFISGEPGLEESVKFGVAGAVKHPQIDYAKVNYSQKPWANQPTQCINYVSCHDNHTLWDRLVNSCPGEPEEELLKMNKLAQTLVLTSQGVPFLHAGEEIVRSKKGVENSYESPDDVNQIDWSNKEKYKDLYLYYRSLVRLRKNHPAFRLGDAGLVARHLEFMEMPAGNMIGYLLKDRANGDSWKRILLIFNGNKEPERVTIPGGNWKIICQNGKIDERGLGRMEGGTEVAGRSALILAED